MDDNAKTDETKLAFDRAKISPETQQQLAKLPE
jgi:hypothetical protein